MHCRPYNPTDFAALYAIEERCFEPLLRFGRRMMQRLVVRRSAATWIAEHEGRMVGFAIVEWQQAIDGRAAYLQTLEVAPEARRTGAGSALLEACEQSASTACADRFWLHVDEENLAAIHLYQNHGLLCEGRVEDYYPLGRAALVYGKELAGSGFSARRLRPATGQAEAPACPKSQSGAMGPKDAVDQPGAGETDGRV